MKRLIIMMVCLFMFVTTAEAQLKHYISFNTAIYNQFFTGDKFKIHSKMETYPEEFNVSYKIEKRNWGVELHYSQNYGKKYNPSLPHDTTRGNLESLSHTVFGINVHYAVVQHKRINLNPFLGLAYGDYTAVYFDELRWDYSGAFPRRVPYNYLEKEKQLGIQTGVNVNIPIYWGIYTNANLRYNVIPWAKYNKQNLYWDVGIGYCIQRKKKRSE